MTSFSNRTNKQLAEMIDFYLNSLLPADQIEEIVSALETELLCREERENAGVA